MVPPTNILYNPSHSNAPLSSLPEHMHGLIDLATLADMNRFLGESLSQDDLALAGWIKDNFLYEPLQQNSRPIRTPEGFSKLDHAYRRVRSLTNKVQDKWPFFDQNFKVMSTSTVRNNSRGEISPGVMFQHKHDAAQVNGGTPTNASPTPELQVPFGAHQLGRNRSQKKDPMESSEHALAPPPSKLLALPNLSPEKEGEVTSSSSSPSLQSTIVDSTKFVGLTQYTNMIFNSARQPTSRPEAVVQDDRQSACDACQDVVPIQTDNNPERSTNDLRAARVGSDLTALRNPNGGHIRGTNGRFQPRKMSESASNRTTQRRSAKVKLGRKSKYTHIYDEKHVLSKSPTNKPLAKPVSIMGTRSAQATTHSSVSIPAIGHDSMPIVQSPSTPFKNNYIENNEATELPILDLALVVHDEETADFIVKAEKPRVRFSDAVSENPSPSYSLAVESDPVVSNLDRLPPKSLRRAIKRKNMPNSQSISRKRVQSSKLGDVSVALGRDVMNGVDIAQEGDKIGVTTRRSARRSAAAEKDMTTVPEIKKTKDEPTKDPGEHNFDDEHATMVEVEAERTTTGQEKSTPIPSLKASKALPKVVPRSTSPRAARSRASNLGFKKPTNSTSHPTSDHFFDFAMSQMGKVDCTSSQRGLKPRVVEASIPTDNSASRISGHALSMSPTQETASSFTELPEIHMPHSIAIDVQQTVTIKPEVGKVEYFARVHTTTGPIDIPMSAGKIKDEEEQILKKYSEFVSKKGSAAIDYDGYREIYVSTK